MTKKTLFLLLLIGNVPTSFWAQQCNGFHWFVSGGVGNGTQPDYSLLEPGLSSFQAQYGGVGPVCSAQWEGVQGVWGAWNGVCATIPASCTYTPPPVGGCSTCNVAGSPIDLGNGNTFIEVTDVRIPGLGGGLTLTRTWTSRSEGGLSGGMFGPGWVSNFEERVYSGSDGMMKYQRSDGSIWSFGFYGVQPFYPLVSPANGQATMTEVIDSSTSTPTGWLITFQNGEQRYFGLNPSPYILRPSHSAPNSTGWLTSITDRNGHTTTLTYKTQTSPPDGYTVETNLLSVADAAGRHLYFTYDSSGSVVTNVTSDSGRGINLAYAYSATLNGPVMLSQVTQPDNSFVTYTYDSLSHVIGVNDMNGIVLESHTYDAAGRGLSSSRANGVDGLSITYP